MKPLATVLFGSRARGDHEEGRSDTDILLVVDEEPGEADREEMVREENRRAGLEPKGNRGIQIVWVTPDTLREESSYLNTLCTRALREGVMIADDPERFRSPWDGPDPPEPRYNWRRYQWSMHACRENLKIIRVTDAAERGDRDVADYTRIDYPWCYFLSRQTPDWKKARQAASRAMHDALEAAILAQGGFTRLEGQIPENARRLRDMLPREAVLEETQLEKYHAGGEEPSPDDRSVALAGLEDVERIRKLAMRLRRQTQRAAKAA